ncbi:MAG: hypothetical protein WBI47_05605 [Atribacterales bacterium]
MLRKRVYSFLLAVVVIGLIAMLAGFVPQWKYSILSLKDLYRDIEFEISNYENNLLEKEQREKDLEAVKKELDNAQAQAPDLTRYEAIFHYPSLLILLEEEALKRDLELEIHHGQIRNTSHMIERELEEDAEDNKVGADKTVAPAQRGVDITIVPITIKGDYESIRDYIVFLEERDYMAVNSYGITAGEINTAHVEISVYSVIVN